MRGSDLQTDVMFCYGSPETFVPQEHPLRPIRAIVEKALSDLTSEFAAMYSHTRAPLGPAGEPAQGAPASGVLLDQH